MGKEVYLYSFFNFCVRWRRVIKPKTRSIYSGKDSVPTVQEAGLVWTEAEALHPLPFGVRTPKLPARSESLYPPTTTSKYNAYVYMFEEIFLIISGKK
jgi:hypothetical protein